MKKFKNNEVKAITQGVSKSISGIREAAVAGEIEQVKIEIVTKDGQSTKLTVLGTEIRKRLGVYQTISNCIGFPAGWEADFATIRSALNRPTPLLRDYLEGKLDVWFDRKYRSAFMEMKDGEYYLRLPKTWDMKADKFYKVGKKKDRYELDLSICDYLHKQKTKQKK